MSNLFYWDDLRLALEIFRTSGVSEAARNLNINHSTAIRRITMLEKKLGVRIFERLKRGYVATSDGLRVISAAEKVDDCLLGAEKTFLNLNNSEYGNVRVIANDFLYPALAQAIRNIPAKHPNIRLHFREADDVSMLVRREVDIALIAMRSPPENLFGRRLADLKIGIFKPIKAEETNNIGSSVSILQRDGCILSNISTECAIKKNMDPNYTYGNFLALLHSMKNGNTNCVLPSYFYDNNKNSHSFESYDYSPDVPIWILTHREICDIRRIRIIINEISNNFEI